MLRKIIILLLAGIFILPVLALGSESPEKTLTLAQAINTALENNPNLESMVRSVEQSEYIHNAASKEWLPVLTTDYGFTWFGKKPMFTDTTTESTYPLANHTSYVWGTHIKMPLYTSGALKYKETIEGLGIDVAKMRYFEARADLIQEVTINYFNVLKLQSQQLAVAENLSRFREHERMTAKYFSVGLVPKNSLLEIQAKRAHSKQESSTVGKELKIAEAALNVSMGIDIDSHFKLTDEPDYRQPPFTLEECFAVAQKRNPSYVAFTYLKKRAEKVMQLEKTDSRPKVLADLSFYEHGKTPEVKGDDFVSNDILTGQIVVQWNVFDWFKARDRVEAARKDMEKVVAEQRSSSDRIQLDIRDSYFNLEAAKDRFAAVKEEMRFAKENYRIAKLRYIEKVARSTEVNDALVLLKQAEFDYLATAFEYNVAMARLERVTGANIDLEKTISIKPKRG